MFGFNGARPAARPGVARPRSRSTRRPAALLRAGRPRVRGDGRHDAARGARARGPGARSSRSPAPRWRRPAGWRSPAPCSSACGSSSAWAAEPHAAAAAALPRGGDARRSPRSSGSAPRAPGRRGAGAPAPLSLAGAAGRRRCSGAWLLGHPPAWAAGAGRRGAVAGLRGGRRDRAGRVPRRPAGPRRPARCSRSWPSRPPARSRSPASTRPTPGCQPAAARRSSRG